MNELKSKWNAAVLAFNAETEQVAAAMRGSEERFEALGKPRRGLKRPHGFSTKKLIELLQAVNALRGPMEAAGYTSLMQPTPTGGMVYCTVESN